MYKFVSGAKSVKQYRGDENLPEAKKGMKNCGCKHSKSKYKYQDGTDDLSAEVDNDPEIIELNRKLKEANDKYLGKTTPKPVVKPVVKTTPAPEKKVIAKVQTSVQKPTIIKKQIVAPKKRQQVFLQKEKDKKVTNTQPAQENKILSKFLDPSSKGVLMSQIGKSLPPVKSLKDELYNFSISKKIEKPKMQFTGINPNEEVSLVDKISSLVPEDIKQLVSNNSVSRWPYIAQNYFKRKMNLSDENVDVSIPTTSTFKNSKTKEQEEVPIIIKDKDSNFKKRQYKQQSLDPDKIIWGYRNRGNLKPFKSEGLEITTFEPFGNKAFGNDDSVIALDTIQGKMETGKYKDFQNKKNYIWSPTTKNDIKGFLQDEEGNLKLKRSEKNTSYNVPEVEVANDKKGRTKGSLNFLVKSDKTLNSYGSNQGGRVLLFDPVTKKRKFVSGTLSSVKDQFDKFKKQNNSPYLETYNLDNGTYNKGLSFEDSLFTGERLQKYDDLNTTGGSGLYIKGYKKDMGTKKLKKYKYGTGALTIPEGSAIVTANGGKNKQALMAYKKGNYKLLNNIIEDMPEDRVDKAQVGKKSTKVTKGKLIKGKIENRPISGTNKTFTEQSALGYDPSYGKEMTEDKAKEMYGLSLQDYITAVNSGKYPKVTHQLETARRDAVSKGLKTFKLNGKEYLSGFENETVPEEKPKDDSSNKKLEEEKGKDNEGKKEEETEETEETSKNKFGNFPSMAEVAARGSILSQGVEGVPENYLKLGRYKYSSQLDRTLRENAVAANAAKETIRDTVGGNAGNFLSNVANITGKRFDANSKAVSDDTIAAQDILNKNVDLGNTEITTNTGLKNQYALQRSANRGAYNNQLIALGQGVDTAVDASKLMSSQRASDDVRTNLLKTGNYSMDKEGNVKLIGQNSQQTASSTFSTPTKPNRYKKMNSESLVPKDNNKFQQYLNTFNLDPFGKKKGAKKLKTYKRK
jgi:hypothetical protein